jgi:hypothetical protein
VNGNFSNIIVLEENYEVLQFHVHFPPEHAVDGAWPAGELQGVHRRVGASGLDELLGIGLMSMLARRTLPLEWLGSGGSNSSWMAWIWGVKQLELCRKQDSLST